MDLVRYSFVALTTCDLARARWFWNEQLEFPVIDEEPGHHFVVEAGTLRLRVNVADGDVHRPGNTDPIIAFEVSSLDDTLQALAAREIYPHRGPQSCPLGLCAELRDPDGRAILLAEAS